MASLFEPELKELRKSTDACDQVLPNSSRRHHTADFETGDFVILGGGATGVVSEVTPVDCLVAVLDPSGSFKVGEQHVKSSDLQLIHRDWRIGSWHQIAGLQSSRMKHLNGRAACVREHRRYGHPCFVQRDLKLRLCVRWEDPEDHSNGALLLEPRFLTPAVDNTLLTAKRRSQVAGSTTSIKAIDEMEPTICTPSKVESLTPSPNCSGTFLGALSWLVGARSRHVEEEFPTVIRLSSVLAAEPPPEQLSWLLPISEDVDDLLSESTDRLQGITEHIEQGDLVIIDRSLQPFALCPAVVIGVDHSGCKLAVLDECRSVFRGECHAAHSDVALVHTDWRLGTRVVLGGLQSSHMVHLNGLSAVICPHKRHGHPCFVQKPSSPKSGDWLTLCIRFEEPQKSSMHAVLLEPRFLASDRPKASPRLECFTPASGPVCRSLTERSYHKLPSRRSRANSHRMKSKPASATTSPGSVFRQFSLPSTTSGDSRASFAEVLGEDDLVQEIKELKESLKSLTKDQGRL